MAAITYKITCGNVACGIDCVASKTAQQGGHIAVAIGGRQACELASIAQDVVARDVACGSDGTCDRQHIAGSVECECRTATCCVVVVEYDFCVATWQHNVANDVASRHIACGNQVGSIHIACSTDVATGYDVASDTDAVVDGLWHSVGIVQAGVVVGWNCAVAAGDVGV